MTKKKVVREQAWFVDETVPKLLGVLPRGKGIDVAEFSAWLGPVLGKYRDDMMANAALSPLSEQSASLRRAGHDIKVAIASLRAMVSEADARLSLAAKSFVGDDWMSFKQRLLRDMDTALMVMEMTETSIAHQTSKRGRKPTGPRDVLFAEVVAKLRAAPMKAEAAEAAASSILERCKVKAAVIEPESIRKASRRGKKKP